MVLPSSLLRVLHTESTLYTLCFLSKIWKCLCSEAYLAPRDHWARRPCTQHLGRPFTGIKVPRKQLGPCPRVLRQRSMAPDQTKLDMYRACEETERIIPAFMSRPHSVTRPLNLSVCLSHTKTWINPKTLLLPNYFMSIFPFSDQHLLSLKNYFKIFRHWIVT